MLTSAHHQLRRLGRSVSRQNTVPHTQKGPKMSAQPCNRRLSALSLAHAARGFTLIEVMVVVAIVAILATIAIPNYRDYVIRGKLVDGTTGLSTFRANMERYFQDNRTYLPVSATIVPPCDASLPASQRTVGTFVMTCEAATHTATNYKLIAKGSDGTLDFTFTLTMQDIKGTDSAATGWGVTPATCWLLKRGHTC
jgi:prepilin-type N-terminal cleavage/methylation domain-containing protein